MDSQFQNRIGILWTDSFSDAFEPDAFDTQISFFDKEFDDFFGQPPFFTFFLVKRPACFCDFIIGPAFSIAGILIKRSDVSVFFHPVECRIQGRFFDGVFAIRDFPDLLGKFIAVGRLFRKKTEDHRVVVSPDHITADSVQIITFFFSTGEDFYNVALRSNKMLLTDVLL